MQTGSDILKKSYFSSFDMKKKKIIISAQITLVLHLITSDFQLHFSVKVLPVKLLCITIMLILETWS